MAALVCHLTLPRARLTADRVYGEVEHAYLLLRQRQSHICSNVILALVADRHGPPPLREHEPLDDGSALIRIVVH